ncbi:hypothetical protein SKAU_G00385480 [Synaphobranchus kaupii]|uniref:Uncharacterized protein n=1 Tax=Synaphobranchus kaupii TaxID=118154 RepID=A0A9Q1EEG9_SYNKA|nr:hypothetical protein SKAU_G00385480 [Synaphobranchus kaupii]
METRLETQLKEVVLPADVIKVLESDFVERASEDGYISQEDLRFLSKMEKVIRLMDDGHYEIPLPFKKERPNIPDNKHLAAEGRGHFSEDTVKFIQRNFHVDDSLSSVAFKSQAIQLVKEARELCSTGKLRLHTFISNSKEVLATIPKEECAEAAKDLDMALVYDPLGFVAHFILVEKQILQQMCRDKLSWDDTLPDDL